MTLLDNARRLADGLADLYDDLAVDLSGDGATWKCSMCDATLPEDEYDDDILAGFAHDPACPWLLRRAMPRIVMALEAARSVVRRFDDLPESDCAGVRRDLRGLILKLGVALEFYDESKAESGIGLTS